MKTIQVSEEKYDEIKSLLDEEEKIDISGLQDLIGKKFFFRTVTYHLTGKVVKVFGSIVELEDAAWIADSGRFMNCIVNGSVDDVEPVGQAFLNIQTVTDFFPWKHNLPMEQI